MYLYKQYIIFIFLLIFSTGTYADSGKILFSFGNVEIKHPDGQIVDAQKGMELVSGDKIITRVNGRVQLIMNDKTIFDLKPNTEFLIEEFIFSDPEVLNTAVAENKSFYRLLRGSFRTISGLIGKRNKKNYRVTTPVATIGIRGTHYVASFCENNCPNQDNGLYLSVGVGGVILTNEAGVLELGAGSIGFVSANSSSPVLIDQNSVSDSPIDQPSTKINKTAQNEDGSVVLLDNGDLPASEDQSDSSGRGLLVANGLIEISEQNDLEINFNENKELEEINFDSVSFSSGTANVVNSGFDSSTGLYWGRWADGNALATTGTETRDLDLSSSSAHWIYTSNTIKPVVPLTGTANFRLIANTNPTDNFGNTGTVGTATLSADFTNQTVDAGVQLEINQETWDASASDVALDGSVATFSGDFNSVEITDANDITTTGSGSLEGFFTGDSVGDVNGAGLGYSLNDDVDTTVEGLVAFEIEPTP